MKTKSPHNLLHRVITFVLLYSNHLPAFTIHDCSIILLSVTVYSGPVGVAAAAAIATAKKRKRPHSFETNPSIRKRQQTRLLRHVLSNLPIFVLRKLINVLPINVFVFIEQENENSD